MELNIEFTRLAREGERKNKNSPSKRNLFMIERELAESLDKYTILKR